jgi:hypothetical protein
MVLKHRDSLTLLLWGRGRRQGKNTHIALEQALSTSYVVWTTLAKFDLHEDNVKFNTKNEE